MSTETTPNSTPISSLTTPQAIMAGALIITIAILVQPLIGTSRTADARADRQAANTGSEERALPDVKIEKDEHIQGNKNARFVLVEYSDLECPYCARLHPIMQQLVDSRNDVAWAYRHFPLDQIHPQARPRAIASECIAEIAGPDAFWAYIDGIFKGADTNTYPAGVNKNAVQACIDAGEKDALVSADLQSGIEFGTQGTPNTIIWDSKTKTAYPVSGAVPLEQLNLVLDSLTEGK